MGPGPWRAGGLKERDHGETKPRGECFSSISGAYTYSIIKKKKNVPSQDVILGSISLKLDPQKPSWCGFFQYHL